MARSRYLPAKDKDRMVWLGSFASKLNLHALTLGISAAELASVEADAAMYTFIVNRVEQMKREINKWVAYKNMISSGEEVVSALPVTLSPVAAPPEVPGALFRRITKMVNRIKNHPNYTESIGMDLGVIGAEITQRTQEMKPRIKAFLSAGKPHIRWKKGLADSIDIYVNRQDGKGFVFLANDAFPDYVDVFEMPAGTKAAVWEYKGIYRVKDQQVGHFSDTISITVAEKIGKRQVSGESPVES